MGRRACFLPVFHCMGFLFLPSPWYVPVGLGRSSAIIFRCISLFLSLSKEHGRKLPLCCTCMHRLLIPSFWSFSFGHCCFLEYTSYSMFIDKKKIPQSRRIDWRSMGIELCNHLIVTTTHMAKSFASEGRFSYISVGSWSCKTMSG